MTKGYIYSMYAGADPRNGWIMNDPIFGRVPTLGACRPDVRRNVNIGDYIFVISGRIPHAQQYVVGGFRVKEKIDQLAAYARFPEYRLGVHPETGQQLGNIIINENGEHHPQDTHTNFERRLENYLIGDEQIVIDTPKGIEIASQETLPLLEDLFGKKGNRVYDIMGRSARKMDEAQLETLTTWMQRINERTR